MSDDFQKRISEQVKSSKIVIYMKGNKQQPMCGFSARVLEIFNKLGKPFETVDVLSNPEIRTRMEEYSSWPTFPQVFIAGEFVGGCDIVSEMNENGELEPLIKKAFGEA